ncbi:MAG: PEP-CTERM sorting domain-containing protein [Gemmatales bacterium]
MSWTRMLFTLLVLSVTASNLFAQSNIISSVIANGDFQSGNTGFSTNYQYRDPLTTTPVTVFDPGTYTIAPNMTTPVLLHPSALNFYDHTFGNASGSFMIINGSIHLGDAIWSTTVDVELNRDYSFSLWAAYWNNSLNHLPELIFSFNDTIVYGGEIDGDIATWKNISANWNSGSNSSVTIKILNTNTDYAGNDFALDDISFGLTIAAVPEPATLVLAGSVLAGAGGYVILKRLRYKITHKSCRSK